MLEIKRMDKIVKKYLGEDALNEIVESIKDCLNDDNKLLKTVCCMTQAIRLIEEKIIEKQGEEFYEKFKMTLELFVYTLIQKISGKEVKLEDVHDNTTIKDNMTDYENKLVKLSLVLSNGKILKTEITKKELKQIKMINSRFLNQEETNENEKKEMIIQTLILKNFISKKENRKINFVDLLNDYFLNKDKRYLFNEFYNEIKNGKNPEEVFKKYITDFEEIELSTNEIYPLQIYDETTNKTILIIISTQEKYKIDDIMFKFGKEINFDCLQEDYVFYIYSYKRWLEKKENKKIDYNDIFDKEKFDNLDELINKFDLEITKENSVIDFAKKYFDESEYEIFTKQ